MRLLPRMIPCLALCCGGLNAFAAIVIETGDGLPVEVEVVSVYRNDLAVRNTASQRESHLDLSRLDGVSQKKVAEVAAELRSKADEKAFRFEARVEENTAREKPKPVKIVGGLEALPEGGKKSAEEPPTTHDIPPTSVALRIAGATNCGADVTLDAKVFWFYRGENRGATESLSEVFKINVTQAPQEMITRSPAFARVDYQGFALMIINPADQKVLWQHSNTNSFLNEAIKLQKGVTK